ncbi:AMP-binding protein [Pimelobacter simplex]|uniref:Acyl-coenzyme A synthetase/AMP-(Fatty) acid ligase n=1 Tax=Nocardioides simplex TaxID=2045 RepID=A0A0A1DK65_NOCSI|nr:AMP-binding protein [Pimelobacter simplex]AIY16963.1 Acyl-coenzyme A synthetase/AMP-(fatty) acid ligase [Pimelobacter simplex]MCG8152121.1 AMP-binding protein [Pimelobacter simplex]GEB12871.1 acetyl-CoA synthetase [Pimelobacter simplex]SFM52997.1 2-aminobenzoate-CoA ligase [Pimelobacter simplex]
MTLTPSGYEDTFARDHLPPAEQWPVLEFTTDELQYPDRLNAAVELVDRAVAEFGADRPALRTPSGETWTLGELQTRSNQVARVLVDELGLRPGNRVLLRSPNNPWTVAAWLGVLKAGGIVVTTFAALRAREIVPLVERTRPFLALVDHRFADDVAEAAPGLTLVTFGGPGDDDLVARAARQPEDFAAVVTAADDVALFCPTSGSTGVPKITTHFHRDVLSIDHTFGRHVLRLRPDDLVACSAPLAFTFGLGMLVVFPLRAGACALLTEAATPLELAEIIARESVTVLATAPTAYRRILGAGRIGDLAGLRVAVSAGEHLPLQTWEHVRDELGLEIIDGIGGTEFLHIYLSAPVGEIRPGTTGRPLPGFRATVLGPDGEELPPGEPGRLAVIGPVGCRYLDDPRQAAYVSNGWNVTGDTFVRDADGYFTYQTRTDNMIVSAGYNIGGPEVEAALDEHPDVVESAVVAAPDAERGSVVCAFVVLAPGVAPDDATVRRLQEHVKQTLAPYKYPRVIRFIEALPRNTSGKLQHFQLRRQVEEEASV